MLGAGIVVENLIARPRNVRKLYDLPLTTLNLKDYKDLLRPAHPRRRVALGEHGCGGESGCPRVRATPMGRAG
jgi:hypothetical protein